jgi:hypothetical protein
MLGMISNILSSFTVPMDIGTNSLSLLWMIPLAVSISVVYKATKVSSISVKNFSKEGFFSTFLSSGKSVESQEKTAPNFILECLILFISIVFFLALSAVIVWGVIWLATE